MGEISEKMPIIFLASLFVLIGIIGKMYAVALIAVIMLVVVILGKKESKMKSKEDRNNGTSVKTTRVPKARVEEFKNGKYRFNLNPDKYPECKVFKEKTTNMLYMDSVSKSYSHWIRVDKTTGELYDTHFKVVGFEGEYKHTREVEDFECEPRKITYEEFIRIADEKYPGIRFIYEGINQENWRLYQGDMLYYWEGLSKPITEEMVDRSAILYDFKHSYDKHHSFLKKHNHKYPLVAISEFLIDNGFTFVEGYCGGGIDEISHSGDKSYSARYTDFYNFRDNFESDLELAESEARSESSGWICSLNYGYIGAVLQRDSLSLRLLRDKNEVRLIWKNISENDFELVEETNQKMEKILESDFTITRKICMKDK